MSIEGGVEGKPRRDHGGALDHRPSRWTRARVPRSQTGQRSAVEVAASAVGASVVPASRESLVLATGVERTAWMFRRGLVPVRGSHCTRIGKPSTLSSASSASAGGGRRVPRTNRDRALVLAGVARPCSRKRLATRALAHPQTGVYWTLITRLTVTFVCSGSRNPWISITTLPGLSKMTRASWLNDRRMSRQGIPCVVESIGSTITTDALRVTTVADACVQPPPHVLTPIVKVSPAAAVGGTRTSGGVS